jgi:hypothetical protein
MSKRGAAMNEYRVNQIISARKAVVVNLKHASSVTGITWPSLELVPKGTDSSEIPLIQEGEAFEVDKEIDSGLFIMRKYFKQVEYKQ